jgi:hypothetical protein
MNIFVLDTNPSKAAKLLCDQHVVKMIVESAQMLCTTHWLTGGQAQYKATHRNHPCTIWCKESTQNYKWLVKHALSLCKEYTLRYGKTHKTQEVIKWCADNIPALPKTKLTDFAQAMPDEYKVSCDAVQAYKNYYIGEKIKFGRWLHSTRPTMFKQ